MVRIEMKQGRNRSLQILAEEAMEWFLTFDGEETPDEEERRRFVKWLRQSPANIEEFLRINAIRADLNRLCNSEDWLISELEAAAKSNVSSMFFSETNSQRIFYNSGVGEQRTVVLDDGSRIELNTESSLWVEYSDSERLVEMGDGEAAFIVAKDASRPFRVKAGPANITAIGTEFSVYRQDQGALVTVMEGQVQVAEVKNTSFTAEQEPYSLRVNVVNLSDGMQVFVKEGGALDGVVEADLDVVTAWRRCLLMLKNQTLVTGIREINRYNKRHIKLADEAAGEVLVSGEFLADKPASFVEFIKTINSVRVETTPNGWLIYLR